MSEMKRIALGGGHSYTPIVAHDNPDEWIGIVEWHQKADGSDCGGSVMFEGHPHILPDGSAGPTWKVLHWDPLHLDPSIQCTVEGCGSHGYIRGGRWEPA